MRLACLLAAAGVLFALAPATPASASTAGYCTTDGGVTVVVDFRELGGDMLVRCAPGAQRSGLTALQSAGITVATLESGVCRLQGKPETCEAGQWSYWNAWNGGTWTASQRAASSSMPPQGTFEGWSFGKAAPRFTPSRPVQPASPPPPTPRSQEQHGGTNPGKGGGVPVVPAPKPQAAPSSSAAPSSGSAPPSSSTPEDAVDEEVPPGSQQPKAQAKPTETAEFPWALLIGAIVLGKVIAFFAWRRKRVPY
ncbi:hypothetical protein [Amycolatopsis sp. NPDC059657]|uniref:hypothetical protein n=1 Tax=Amycolatopsis sp. NPDC059657 TaxID=3346899 RepID=UPI00366D2C8A